MTHPPHFSWLSLCHLWPHHSHAGHGHWHPLAWSFCASASWAFWTRRGNTSARKGTSCRNHFLSSMDITNCEINCSIRGDSANLSAGYLSVNAGALFFEIHVARDRWLPRAFPGTYHVLLATLGGWPSMLQCSS